MRSHWEMEMAEQRASGCMDASILTWRSAVAPPPSPGRSDVVAANSSRPSVQSGETALVLNASLALLLTFCQTGARH